jgi:nicotinamide-nucleotide amidase
VGTAPGLLLETEGKAIFALPGVPLEMQAIFEQEVAPLLETIPAEKVLRRRLRTVGIGESAVGERLRGLPLKEIRLAYLPQPWGVDLWLTARTPATGEAALLQASGQIEKRLGDHVYGVDDDTLERVAAALMIMKGVTIAVAESCTGGLLANRLTDTAGSSAYFERGVVAYSNEAKRQILKVNKRTLERFGAVSQETAVAMAGGVRKISGTDLGLSTTGIAGPSGATPEKPVGTAFIGLAHEESISAQRFLFGGDRKTNKECCVRAALNVLRRHLINL